MLWCAALGLAAGVAVWSFTDVLFGVGVGWSVAATAYLLRTWLQIHGMTSQQTLEHAAADDPSRRVTHLVVLVAAVASLAAVVFALGRVGSEEGPVALAHAVLGVVLVVLSWTLVHTLYTLRYAHLFMQSTERTPVDFNQEAPPDYLDFAYLAFTLGMTYQVSDTNIADSSIRRAALGHSLVSFLFGVVILATSINLVAGMMTGG